MKFSTIKSFERDVGGILDKKLLARLAEVIEAISKARVITDLPNAITMSGNTAAFRVRVGDYRIGAYSQGDTLVLARFLHRKDIYRSFP